MAPDPKQHRKTIEHFDIPGHVHELTFSCYRRRPLLQDDTHCRIVAQAVSQAVGRHRFSLAAFVFMPEHVHLLVFPRSEDCLVSRLLFAIKRPCSYRIKQRLIRHDRSPLRELTIGERPGRATFRFWQEGPGYDRNLTSPDAVRSSIRYVHENPVRRGLCDVPGEWLWSSWRQWHEPDERVPAHVPRIERLRL